ncbi:MAG TPA: xanthine dehydrogenase family protein subunit M [Conexibacter sp.]|jgi:xanthine dehydrogenase YagS FAD-binding subunit
MRPLDFVKVDDVASAVATLSAHPEGAFLAGGTTEIDLVRLGVAKPDLLVDINDLPLAEIDDLPDGGLRIGALARMSDVASDPRVIERFPFVSEALILGASAQLRNMASMAGNLRQRTRCAYFRDGLSPCNKREPGSGCSAIDGVNRGHAILGTSEHCIALHPSDVAVPLVALDAVVHTVGRNGHRAIPFDDFFLLPGDTPQDEHPLEHSELIVAIDVPYTPTARQSAYLKFRDRQSYEFALVSVAAALSVQDGTVIDARVALGGVGTKPWRARKAERALIGAPAELAPFEAAAAAELADATPASGNGFKVELARRAIVRGLRTVMRGMSGGRR